MTENYSCLSLLRVQTKRPKAVLESKTQADLTDVFDKNSVRVDLRPRECVQGRVGLTLA